MSVPALYKHKTSARAAAIKAMGKDGQFEVVKRDDGLFYWIDTSEAAAEAAGAENDPVSASTSDAVEAANEMAWNDGGAMEPDLPALTLTVDESPVEAVTEPEPFEEPEEKANLTIDLGLTPDLIALIYGLGEAAGDAIPVPQKRKGITADAWAAVERGEMPAPLNFPASNCYAQIHADNLLQMTEAGDVDSLKAYPIGGTNTYSKALRSYRDALLAYLGGTSPMQEAA